MPNVNRYMNGKDKTVLQSVLLNKNRFKTKQDCIYYLKTHKYYYDGIDTDPHWQYWRCRQYMPDDTNYYYRVLPE